MTCLGSLVRLARHSLMHAPRITLAIVALSLLLAPGCGARKPQQREITELDRKQAALAVSDAQFSVTMRDWAGAERSYAKATEHAPDNGAHWVSLGTARMKLNQRDAARKAYEQALAAFEAEAKQDEKNPEPALRQIYVQALVGRIETARSLQEKVRQRFPDHPEVKAFVEQKQLERTLQDPNFKEVAL